MRPGGVGGAGPGAVYTGPGAPCHCSAEIDITIRKTIITIYNSAYCIRILKHMRCTTLQHTARTGVSFQSHSL